MGIEMNKILIFLLLGTYALQRGQFFLHYRQWFREERPDQSFARYLLSLSPDPLIEMHEHKDALAELWNCVLLKLGANYHPSLVHGKQIWRLGSCFFLHGSLVHLAFNVAMLLAYARAWTPREATFEILLILASNLVSVALNRYSMFIGCSTLCLSLWTFRVFELLQTDLVRLPFHLIWFILVAWSPVSDATSHLLPVFFTLLYLSLSPKSQKLLIFVLFVFLIVGLGAMMLAPLNEDEAAVERVLELGCAHLL